MHVCGECTHLCGPFEDPHSGRALVQRCGCRGGTPRDDETRWDGYDFNTAVELCHCCGGTLLCTGSRWSSFFCDACHADVRAWNGTTNGGIPLGRHTLMDRGNFAEEEPIAEAPRARRLHALWARIRYLGEWRKRRVRDVLASMSGSANVTAYLAAVRGRRSREGAFAALVAHFDDHCDELDIYGKSVVHKAPMRGTSRTDRAPRKNGIPTARDIAQLVFAFTGTVTTSDELARTQAELEAAEAGRKEKADVPRPSGRTFPLPHGSTARDRETLIQAIATGLLEIRTWPSPGEVGDWSHLVLETDVGGRTLYAQFLSEPVDRGLLCEFASGFYGDASAYRATPAQRGAMVSHRFTDGLMGNFRREDLAFDAPDAARAIAEQTLSVLGSVFGWSPTSAITATLHHGRRADRNLAFDGLTRDDVVEFLTRHGLEARRVAATDAAPDGATVEAASDGYRFTVHFTDPVEESSRFGTIAARARVSEADVESTLLAVDVTEVEIHEWLEQWRATLATASHRHGHVDIAVPVEVKLVSFAAASDLVPWLARLNGLETSVTTAGALEIAHAVRGGTLVLSPSAVRHIALSPDGLLLSVTVERAGALDLMIGPQDFHFAPGEARIELEGTTFVFAQRPAGVSWFETRRRLRALEREMAWAGPLACGGAIAWMHAALAGAERIGLVCTAERERFESVLAAARRSLAATKATDLDRT
jgi:hypothetical protein